MIDQLKDSVVMSLNKAHPCIANICSGRDRHTVMDLALLPVAKIEVKRVRPHPSVAAITGAVDRSFLIFYSENGVPVIEQEVTRSTMMKSFSVGHRAVVRMNPLNDWEELLQLPKHLASALQFSSGAVQIRIVIMERHSVEIKLITQTNDRFKVIFSMKTREEVEGVGVVVRGMEVRNKEYIVGTRTFQKTHMRPLR